MKDVNIRDIVLSTLWEIIDGDFRETEGVRNILKAGRRLVQLERPAVKKSRKRREALEELEFALEEATDSFVHGWSGECAV